MFTKQAKRLFGIQITISFLVGSIPFYWDFKNEKLCKVSNKRFLYKRWAATTFLIWVHSFILVLKVTLCVPLGCLDSWVQTFFHLFWIIGMSFPVFFNYSTVIHQDALKQFVNQMISLDHYLTGK